jgi:integrase
MALEALRTWKAEWPKASSPDYIFPSQKLVYKGRGAATAGRMTPYATDLGKPIGSWKTAWKTAQKVAGVKCRIHDLRHYFITVLGETNAPEQAIKSLAGHVNPKMLERYSHPRSAAKRKAVDAVAEVISGQESKMGD